jgi:hypothetical protein
METLSAFNKMQRKQKMRGSSPPISAEESLMIARPTIFAAGRVARHTIHLRHLDVDVVSE